MVDIAVIESALREVSLVSRGGFHPRREDEVPLLPDGGAVGTVVLVGNVGHDMWQRFRWDRTRDSSPAGPLNTWTRRVLGVVSERYGAHAMYPFDGPPYHPFLRWAQRAEPVLPSPVGPLIHPDYGLWHAYRGALAFAEYFALPEFFTRPCPCHTCRDKPCLSACPVEAFASGRYDINGCLDHIGSDQGTECLHRGCLARRACPVGQQFRYSDEQARFHMEAFLHDAKR